MIRKENYKINGFYLISLNIIKKFLTKNQLVMMHKYISLLLIEINVNYVNSDS